ncbi:MAG: hypothetical protein HY928_05545 [Elusimicrobia bacterium]|nr:hypothetical protein [Elusimicrobiota bacterium]
MTSLFFFLAFVSSLTDSAQASSSNPNLDGLLVEKSIPATVFSNANEPWEAGLRNWAASVRVTGGIIKIEARLRKQASAKPSREPASPIEMLDEISAQNTAYNWTKVQDAINILPKDMSKEPLATLHKPVKAFKSRERNAISAIFGLLRQYKFPVRGTSRYALGGPKPKIIPEPRDFACDGVTILECINELAKAGGLDCWQLTLDKNAQFILSDSVEAK